MGTLGFGQRNCVRWHLAKKDLELSTRAYQGKEKEIFTSRYYHLGGK